MDVSCQPERQAEETQQTSSVQEFRPTPHKIRSTADEVDCEPVDLVRYTEKSLRTLERPSFQSID